MKAIIEKDIDKMEWVWGDTNLYEDNDDKAFKKAFMDNPTKEISTLNIKPRCCGKQMKEVNGTGMLQMDIKESTIWVCLKCGNYLQITTGQLDDEEVDNYREE